MSDISWNTVSPTSQTDHVVGQPSLCFFVFTDYTTHQFVFGCSGFAEVVKLYESVRDPIKEVLSAKMLHGTFGDSGPSNIASF